MRILIFAALSLLWLDGAQAQPYWRMLPSGYQCWGCWREWPRGWYGPYPGYRYYGPGYFRPFSYWGRTSGIMIASQIRKALR